MIFIFVSGMYDISVNFKTFWVSLELFLLAL